MIGNKDEHLFGVDVSKEWLDFCGCGGSPTGRIKNTPHAIRAWMGRAGPRLVALEPTGGFERELCRALGEAGVRWVKLHPNAVLAFRKSRGVRAKTDKIDARLIADYLADVKARGALPQTFHTDEKLKALSARRSQLMKLRNAEKCRASLVDEPEVAESLDLVLEALDKSLETIEAAIERHIAGDVALKNFAQALRGVRGVGPIVAATFLAELPELGRLNGKQIAALVGLAPQTHSSGKSQRQAKTGHGRPRVRDALFNAARAAIRHPCILRDFYNRLVQQNGRLKAVAFTAVMRKILVIANAVARDHLKSVTAQNA